MPAATITESVLQQERKWPRVALKAQVQMRFSSLDAMLRGSLRDLSVGGAFVFSRAPRPVGTRLRLLVLVEDSALRFEAEGEIVHVAESGPAAGMGVRFLSLTPKNRSAIVELVELLQTRQGAR